MATTREKFYDDVLIPAIEYIRGKNFKRDIFVGADPVEVAARDKFFHDLLVRKITRGNPKDGKFTSIFDSLQWLGPTFDVVHAKVVDVLTAVVGVGAKVDALTALVTKALATAPGNAPFDQAKFLEEVEARSEAGALRAIETAAEGQPMTLNVQLGRPDVPEVPTAPEVPEVKA